MREKTKDELKWSIIAITSILTVTAIFNWHQFPSIVFMPLFWIYVVLDKK